MKKIVSILLIAILALSMTACGGKDDAKAPVEVADSQELLQNIWDTYKDDEKFAVIGGDMNPDNTKDNGPGKFGIEDTEILDAVLGFPAGMVEKIDDAASIMHMMNANSFTCGAYRVVDQADVEALSDAIKENIQNRQWMCGFPDELVIVSVDNYIIAFFGVNDITDNFQNKLNDVYPGANVICEESLI